MPVNGYMYVCSGSPCYYYQIKNSKVRNRVILTNLPSFPGKAMPFLWTMAGALLPSTSTGVPLGAFSTSIELNMVTCCGEKGNTRDI